MSPGRPADASGPDAGETEASRISIRWSNVPLPPQHLVGLGLGGILQYRMDPGWLALGTVGRLAGALLLAGGSLLCAWSCLEAGRQELNDPVNLMTGGPYRRSRNPMYVGWTAIYVGIAGIAGGAEWLLLLLPFVLLYTHYGDVLPEERMLRQRFGEIYDRYQQRVPRYL